MYSSQTLVKPKHSSVFAFFHTSQNMGEFEWRIERFLERKSEIKKSSSFQIWSDNCCFYVPGRDGKCGLCSQHYPLYLEKFRKSTCSDERSLKLCLIGRNGKEVFVINRTLLQKFSDDLFLLMTIRDQELQENGNDLLPGGTLTVRLSWNEKLDEKRPMEMLETLSRDLSRFHISNVSTDCVLRVDNTEFPAHRTVLCARSEVFAAMFRHETSESLTGVIDILDVNADVMSDFLKYIYSGKVRGLTTSTAAPLFVVAEKYGLTLLQEACLSFLTGNLTVGNVCDAAVLADTYGEEELEKKVVQFLGDGMTNIQGTADWKQFSLNKHSLAIKLLCSVISCKGTKKTAS